MPETFPTSISNKNCHIFHTYFLIYKSSYSLIVLIFRSTVIIRIKIANLMDLKSDVVGDEGQALDGLQTNQLDLIVEHVNLWSIIFRQYGKTLLLKKNSLDTKI